MDENIKQDKEVAVIEQELSPIEVKVNTLIVTNESSAKLATDYGVAISTYLKKLEEKRKFFVQPLVESQKRINAEFKVLSERLEVMKEVLKGKLLSYRQIVEEVAKKTQEKLNEMAQKNGLPAIEKPIIENQVKSSVGLSFTIRRWNFRVLDEAKIPDEFWLLDEMKIRSRMREGIKNIHGVSQCDTKIEGIEFFQEEDISFKR